MDGKKEEKKENEVKEANTLSHFFISLNTFQNTIKHFRMENGIFCINSKLETLTKNNKNNAIKIKWMEFPSYHSGLLNSFHCCVMLNSHDWWFFFFFFFNFGLLCTENSFSFLYIPPTILLTLWREHTWPCEIEKGKKAVRTP